MYRDGGEAATGRDSMRLTDRGSLFCRDEGRSWDTRYNGTTNDNSRTALRGATRGRGGATSGTRMRRTVRPTRRRAGGVAGLRLVLPLAPLRLAFRDAAHALPPFLVPEALARAAMGMARRTAHAQDVRGGGTRQHGWRRHGRLTGCPILVRHLLSSCRPWHIRPAR